MAVIGFLNSGSLKPFAQRVAAFHKGLKEQGYANDRNVKVEESWAEGDENRLMPLARELVEKKVKLIAATGGITSAETAREVTPSIPVLFDFSRQSSRTCFRYQSLIGLAIILQASIS
jgi:putative tryptophan/tyrosine transport system substrate-binding protein